MVTLIGQGRTTKVYRDGEKAIKLYVQAPPDEADNEAARQMFAYNAGLPVPRVWGVEHVKEGVALIMDYIQGTPLVDLTLDDAGLREAIAVFAGWQHRIHQVDGTGQPSYMERTRWKLEHSPNLDAETLLRLQRHLSIIDEGETNFCHGDFHPQNVIRDGEKYWIIDWVDANCGSPFADACRTFVLFRQFGDAYMANLYLQAFCRTAKVKADAVLRWLPIVAAVRLTEAKDKAEIAFLSEAVQQTLEEAR